MRRQSERRALPLRRPPWRQAESPPVEQRITRYGPPADAAQLSLNDQTITLVEVRRMALALLEPPLQEGSWFARAPRLHVVHCAPLR